MKVVPLLIGLLLPAAVLALDASTASRAQLEQLQGLGAATVGRILRARDERPVSGWDDLADRVAGLRGKRAEQLARQGLGGAGRPLATAAGERK